MELFKVKINENNLSDVLDKILDSIRGNRKTHIVTLNPEIMLLAKSSAKYRDIINAAQIKTVDGVGLLRALRRLDRNFSGQLVTGTDLLYCVCKLSQDKKIRIFFLGGGPGVAARARHRARKLYPACHIVGDIDGITIDPYKTDTNLISRINSSKPDVLFVALGAPKQEIWIHNNSKVLNAKVMIGVGGALDFMSGDTKRAPKLMRRLGLEWFFRLLTNPLRIRRIYNATIVFPREIKKENRTK